MGELLRALVEDPEAIRAAVAGSGMSRQEVRAVVDNARTVVDRLPGAGRYDLLRAFLDQVDRCARE